MPLIHLIHAGTCNNEMQLGRFAYHFVGVGIRLKSQTYPENSKVGPPGLELHTHVFTLGFLWFSFRSDMTDIFLGSVKVVEAIIGLQLPSEG